jgi:hypothetical protein
MKFPSIKSLADNFTATLRRFPLEIGFALLGTIAGTIAIELNENNRIFESWCMRAVMIANLGLLLSLSATLYTRSIKQPPAKKAIIRLIAALIAILLIFLIDPSERQADYTRFFLLSLSFHLLVAFAAFTGKGRLQGFWQFNKTLFLRFLTSVLYAVVLYLGLAAAIGAMNFLFNLKIEWQTFAILWAWTAGVFTTIFFLAGVPPDAVLLDDDLTYPKGLKIFTQYVLIPLSTVYVAILLAYEIKILIQWKLPKGLVSNLILGYAVFGILSLLLLYPVREQSENKWLKTYARSFYFLLLPLLVLLFVAVGARISSYGITEYRYFLILLAFWLLFISVYFLFFRKQNIKLIPVSLCILTLLAVYGPQSAFSVSMYSQRNSLVNFFEKNHAVKNGKIIPVVGNKITRKDGSQAVANLKYFIDNYDLAPLQPYISKDLKAISDSIGKQKNNNSNNYVADRYQLRNSKLDWAKNYLGLGRFESYNYYAADTADVEKSYHFTPNEKITTVKGYDFLINSDFIIQTYNRDNSETEQSYGGIRIKQKAGANHTFILQLNNDTLIFDIEDAAKKLLSNPKLQTYYQASEYAYMAKTYSFPQDMLTITKETGKYIVGFKIDNLYFTTPGNLAPDIQTATGECLIKVK